MIKVLHFYKTYYPDTFGGIEQVIFQLAEGTINSDIETTVLSLTPGEENLNATIGSHKTIRIHADFSIASSPFSIKALSLFKKLASEADIIHYHFPWPFMDALHFICKINKPTVLSYHSDIVRQKNLLKIYTPLMHKFMSSVGKIVATSPNYVKTSPTLNKYLEKVQVIPIGIDQERYKLPNAAVLNSWRERLPERFFLFVGTLRYYKGLHILVEANKKKDFPIVIVGSGPIENELKLQVKEYGLKNIIFLGALNDIDKIALLHLCYAMVFPSHLRSEAFGISLLEGAMFSKPLISSEIGTGTSWINIHHETGIVIPPSDPNALAIALDTLWANSDLAKIYGERAYQRYREHFTGVKMVSAYQDLYNSMIK
ncbi:MULTISPECIES: glycosyltransferase [Pantoea]|uniref:glycosyltransferase n=1 Tax=Pantoea TaxID=53335 RepID=UPI0007362277|nr:glycosyltransferase [Pantoea dispersa]KTS36749.1 glycosyl transferase family 1 [Pantoea dispersa]KTS51648.1 glycosyl transferase family 1 [Pantoea dispersa]RVU75430.1 glycosyltransferase [Pantoea dispersa]